MLIESPDDQGIHEETRQGNIQDLSGLDRRGVQDLVIGVDKNIEENKPDEDPAEETGQDLGPLVSESSVLVGDSQGKPVSRKRQATVPRY